MVELVFSTPINWITEAVYSGIVNKPIVLNGLQPFYTNVHIEEVEFSNPVTVRTISPIVVSFYKNKRTVYLNPLNTDFTKALKTNVLNKYIACKGRQPKDTHMSFALHSARERVLKVNFGYDYVIKAYDCVYTIGAKDNDFLAFALMAGLGMKTALGFGCVEIA